MKCLHLFILCLCGALSSCSTGASIVTLQSYEDMPTGATSEDLIARLGQPYAKHNRPEGAVEYEYIERINVGVRNFEERHYFFLIKNDRIVSRRMTMTSPPPYRFDSYDMQTTQK